MRLIKAMQVVLQLRLKRLLYVAATLGLLIFCAYLLGLFSAKPVKIRASKGKRITPDLDSILPPRTFNLTFWSMDWHPAPIWDLKTFLTPFGVRFKDKSLSWHCGKTDSCGTDLTVKLTIDKNIHLERAFYEAYKNHPIMEDVDAFVCFHPAGMCETFIPFGKPILVIATTRYELGRHSAYHWEVWNSNLRIISKIPGSLVAANNKYDAEYIKYFTCLEPVIIPSWCGYPNDLYAPTRKEFLWWPSHDHKQLKGFNEWFLESVAQVLMDKGDKETVIVAVRKKYPFYEYDDIVAHRAIIYTPYQVSIMSIFEQYRMEIPLFFPSKGLLVQWQLDYHILSERTWDMVNHKIVPTGSVVSGCDAGVPDPNDETSREAITHWIEFSDFYDFPHIILYDSLEDLIDKLKTTDFRAVSGKMHEYNIQLKRKLSTQWDGVLETIAKARGKM